MGDDHCAQLSTVSLVEQPQGPATGKEEKHDTHARARIKARRTTSFERAECRNLRFLVLHPLHNFRISTVRRRDGNGPRSVTGVSQFSHQTRCRDKTKSDKPFGSSPGAMGSIFTSFIVAGLPPRCPESQQQKAIRHNVTADQATGP